VAFVLEFTSCRQVSAALIEDAFAAPSEADASLPRDRVARLMKRMARVATPGEEAGRLLLVCRSLAEAPWLGGLLDVRMREVRGRTQLELRVDTGQYFTPFMQLELAVALSELREWTAQNLAALQPLAVSGDLDAETIRVRIPQAPVLHENPHTRATADNVPRASHPPSRRPTLRVAVGADPKGGAAEQNDTTEIDDQW
jgi:hypothetical protein